MFIKVLLYLSGYAKVLFMPYVEDKSKAHISLVPFRKHQCFYKTCINIVTGSSHACPSVSVCLSVCLAAVSHERTPYPHQGYKYVLVLEYVYKQKPSGKCIWLVGFSLRQ